jgi:hypothetical protein
MATIKNKPRVNEQCSNSQIIIVIQITSDLFLIFIIQDYSYTIYYIDFVLLFVLIWCFKKEISFFIVGRSIIFSIVTMLVLWCHTWYCDVTLHYFSGCTDYAKNMYQFFFHLEILVSHTHLCHVQWYIFLYFEIK